MNDVSSITPVTNIFSKEKIKEVSHLIIAKELNRSFEKGQFIFIDLSPEGNVRFILGQKLSVGNMSYLKDVFNFKCNEVLKNSNV